MVPSSRELLTRVITEVEGGSWGGDAPRLLGVPICRMGTLAPTSEEPQAVKCFILCPRVPAGHSWEPWCLLD